MRRRFESLTSHLRVFEECIIDQRILYHECSLIHPIAKYFVHDRELPSLFGKSELQRSGHICALTGGQSFALSGGESFALTCGEKRVERRCDCETCRFRFPLEKVFHGNSNGNGAGGRGIGSRGVPAGLHKLSRHISDLGVRHQ